MHQTLHVALLVSRLHLAWHQAQRTVRDALAALDAGSGLGRGRLGFSESENRVGVFENRLLQIRHRNAHHGSAVKHHLRLFLEPAGRLEHVLHPRADRHEHVHGILDCRAVDRHALFDERQTGSAVSCDGRNRRTVENHRADVQRKLSFGDLLARHVVNQNLLAALRVHRLERHDFHVLLVFHKLSIARNALRLVVLDAEDDARHLQKLLQQPAARDHVKRVVDHRARIGGDVRLALGAVDDHAFDLVEILDRQLDDRREARAAQANQAAGAHGVQEVLHGI